MNATIRRRLRKEFRIDLGIAVAHALCPPSGCMSVRQIAAFAGCRPNNIHEIEKRALKKVRAALFGQEEKWI